MVERPWLKNYTEGVDWHAPLEPAPLFKLLDDTAARHGDLPALDFLGRRYTFAEIKRLADKAACGFARLGVTKGVKVGLFLPNCPQFVIAYFGILKAGGTVVNFSPLYSEPELLAQVEDSETDIMVTLDLNALYPKLAAIFGKSRLRILVVGNMPEVLPFPQNVLFPIFKRKDVAKVAWDASHVRFRDLLQNDGACPLVAIDPMEDVAVLQYTGGTTGTPKGAMLTHANLYINAMQSKLADPDLTPGQDRSLAALPLFHVFAMTGVMNLSIAAGIEMLMLPKFELEAAMKLIRRRKATIMMGVPTMYHAFLNHPLAAKGGLRSLRACISGGAPLPVELKKAFEEVSGCKLVEGYGLTESAPVAALNPSDRARAGSIGLPVPGTDIVIVDHDDPTREMPLGEIGELAIAGPQVMKGYWKRPDATARAIVNGRLLTGDLGYMDEDGYTYIIDRAKDLILVGGFNVFPRLVEEAIYTHPAVAEAVVIGVPDEHMGEIPKAFVTLKPGHEGLTADELISYLRTRIGKHELPREVEFRDQLPKTMIGKLSKKELIAEEKAKRAAAEAEQGPRKSAGGA